MSDQPQTQIFEPENRRGVSSFSLFFVLVFGAVAIIQPYLNLYYQSIGFTGVQIGLVATIGALVVVVLAPQYGNFYDHSQHKRRFLVVTTLVALVALSVVPFISVFLVIVILYSVHHVIYYVQHFCHPKSGFSCRCFNTGKEQFRQHEVVGLDRLLLCLCSWAVGSIKISVFG